MNKTAMQMLESKYESDKSEYVSVNDLLAEIRNMLPTEKQQIEDAFKAGHDAEKRMLYAHISEKYISLTPENYFSTTYNTNQ